MPRLPRNLYLVDTWRSPTNTIAKKRNATRLKCYAYYEKLRWTRPKCCAYDENRNASSKNVAEILRLPHKTIFDMLRNTSPRLPRETKQRNIWNIQQ